MASQSTTTKQSQPAWPGRTHVTTFIRCLHLLDLPLLTDWPGISEQTFSKKTAQQNLQTRVKAVEWSLYRLFELYNVNETKDKLRPFFPPAAPIQSLNLRAALYRCLTDLKKNGVLNKEILLRKTMLDDCKGEKFEETIASFAMVVLEKVVSAGQNVGVKVRNAKLPDYQLLPLILALRKTLQLNIDTRRQLKLDHQVFAAEISAVEYDLQQRMIEASSCTIESDHSLEEALKSLVNTNWVGNRTWAEILLHGLPLESVPFPAPPLGLSDKPVTVDDHSASITENSVIKEMSAKIHTHRTRLAEWEGISKELAAKRVASQTATATQPEVKPMPKAKRFSKHQDLHLNHPNLGPMDPPAIAPQYQSILDSMRQDTSRPRPKQRSDARNQERTRSILDPNAPSQRGIRSMLETPIADSSLITNVTPLQTSALGPEPSVKESNHDEREPQSPHTSKTIEPAGMDIDIQDNSVNIDLQLQALTLGEDPRSELSPVSSIVDETDSSIWMPESKINVGTPQVSSPRLPVNQNQMNDDGSGDEVDELPNLPSSPTKEWMSLTDRTRASMNKFGSYRNQLDSDPIESTMEQSKPQADDGDEHSPIARTPPLSATTTDSRQTLLERTRQSMSLLANSANLKQRSRKSHAANRSSQVFPVNQFETPRSGKTFTHNLNSSTINENKSTEPDSRASTPRDKLFDAEAEYTSVFKSRPKVALDSGFSTDMTLLSASEKIVPEDSHSDDVENNHTKTDDMNLKPRRSGKPASPKCTVVTRSLDPSSGTKADHNNYDLTNRETGTETDYASVFRSRPKIATSPSLSPERYTLNVTKKNHNGPTNNTEDVGNDNLDTEADYDSVFKSRPKVAISAEWSSEMSLLSSSLRAERKG